MKSWQSQSYPKFFGVVISLALKYLVQTYILSHWQSPHISSLYYGMRMEQTVSSAAMELGILEWQRSGAGRYS